MRSIPIDEKQALEWLLPLLDARMSDLRNVPKNRFKRAWSAIAFLYAGLHPDSALEHGVNIRHDSKDYQPVGTVEPRLINPYYEESGWPVVLAPVALEAWRRYENNLLSDNEFYPSTAQMAGMQYRLSVNSESK